MACLLSVVIGDVLGLKLSLTEAIILKTGLAQIKHGITTWLRTGRLNPSIRGHKKLERYLIELQPVLGKQFLAFLNTLRQNLIALGLDRQKAEEIIDLKTYIESRKNQNGKGSQSAHRDR